jgi:long-chain acyl-CoA synthetase
MTGTAAGIDLASVPRRFGVAAHAAAAPQKAALVWGARRLTYGDVDRSANAWARVLAERGVGPGARLGLALQNRPEWMLAALGAARLGAEVVPIPHGATPEEREYFASDGAVAFCCDEQNLGETLAAVAAASEGPLEDPEADYVVLRAYTSGTTGRPKAVVRPEVPRAALMLGVVQYFESYGLAGPDEVNLTASPLHHLAGFSGPHSAWLLGHTCVLMERYEPAEALRSIAAERVTYWMCAPIHLYRLLRLPPEVLAGADVSSVRRVLHGSAPCPEDLKRATMAFFPPGAVWETYGGTETMGTVITPEEWERKPGSVGRPARGSVIRILDPDGAELGPGEVGLVYIGSEWGRGFRYGGPDELTDAVYRGDLATLGDVGYLDDDGYLFLVDRAKDVVITGGANVYPAEVEAVLVRHPQVAEVAVVGVADPEFGELVTAVVVPEPGAGPGLAAELDGFCRRHLVAYKCPRRYELVEALPRDPMGKVRKRELRDRLGNG